MLPFQPTFLSTLLQSLQLYECFLSSHSYPSFLHSLIPFFFLCSLFGHSSLLHSPLSKFSFQPFFLSLFVHSLPFWQFFLSTFPHSLPFSFLCSSIYQLIGQEFCSILKLKKTSQCQRTFLFCF